MPEVVSLDLLETSVTLDATDGSQAVGLDMVEHELISLDLADGEPVILDIGEPEVVTLILVEPETVALALTESVVSLEVIGEIGPRGLQGVQGDAATIAVGPTITGLPGTSAGVVNTGDVHDAILDFTIPRGDVGPQGVPGPAGIDTGAYRHNQGAPASVWFVQHDLGYYPAVAVQDSAGSVVYGDVFYIDANSLTISFDAAFGGFANLS